MGRKKAFRWRWRLAAVLVLLLTGVLAYFWWLAQRWQPDRAQFPVQGALVGARDGEVDFPALAAIGADFVYLEASQGGEGRDAMFGANWRRIGEAGIPHGTVHAYDPCVPAERQGANFVTIVPRGAGSLPPVIALDTLAGNCDDPMMEVAIESELTTFINQVEGHAGQPAILKLSPEFEEAYGVASRIERNLWLTSAYRQPDYAGRPWTLWTANPQLDAEAAEEPLRWLAVQP